MSPRLLLVSALLLSMSPAILPAQVYTGTIWARVSDFTGSVLPRVEVTLSSDRLIQDETAFSSENGTCRFAELPIGAYTLTFELAGFQTLIRRGIVLTAGATVPVIVELQLASVAETVSVSGESPAVDIRQTGTPQSFNQDRLEKVPSARDP